MVRLQLKRGFKTDLPSTNLLEGEPLIALDTGELFVATGEDTVVPVVPAIAQLSDISPIQPEDSFLVYSANGQAAGRIALSNLTLDCGFISGAG